jgi:hypothetical protein
VKKYGYSSASRSLPFTPPTTYVQLKMSDPLLVALFSTDIISENSEEFSDISELNTGENRYP